MASARTSKLLEQARTLITQPIGLGADWRHAASREQQIELTNRAAKHDEAFRQLATEGNRARDERRWSAAENFYSRALRLYPLKSGYRVQLGHMLKEQNQFTAAEVQYRSGLALGASSADVDQHLSFVASRQDYFRGRPPLASRSGAPMSAPPTAYDLDTLAFLLWREEQMSEIDAVALLRSCETCQAAAIAMMQDNRFFGGNRVFLELLRGLR